MHLEDRGMSNHLLRNAIPGYAKRQLNVHVQPAHVSASNSFYNAASLSPRLQEKQKMRMTFVPRSRNQLMASSDF